MMATRDLGLWLVVTAGERRAVYWVDFDESTRLQRQYEADGATVEIYRVAFNADEMSLNHPDGPDYERGREVREAMLGASR